MSQRANITETKEEVVSETIEGVNWVLGEIPTNMSETQKGMGWFRYVLSYRISNIFQEKFLSQHKVRCLSLLLV
jgi:hypothetical protein